MNAARSRVVACCTGVFAAVLCLGPHGDVTAGGKATTAEDAVSAAFAKLKTLVGEWDGSFEWTGRKASGTVNARYYLTGNAAVIENLTYVEAGELAMTSVYHLDNGDLRMTHFCVQNQPRLRATRIDIGKGALDFSFVDATNLSSPDAPKVDGVEMRFLDPDHITLTFLVDGGAQHLRELVTLHRKQTGG
jgi:hypothetical protein